MFRARLASVVVAASLAASGCHCFEHSWFDCNRERNRCAPPPCDPCATASGMPIAEGPILTGPPPGFNGQPLSQPVYSGPPQQPANGQPRPAPPSQFMPIAH